MFLRILTTITSFLKILFMRQGLQKVNKCSLKVKNGVFGIVVSYSWLLCLYVKKTYRCRLVWLNSYFC